MEKVSQHSDLVFDAVGGELANTLLSVLRSSTSSPMGCYPGGR